MRVRLDRVSLGDLGDCHGVGEGVQELRIDYGPGYRVYFGQEGTTVVLLLCGGDKSKQAKDIEVAIRYWSEYRKADMKNTKAYQSTLIESLRDAGEAEEYLNAVLEEEDPELFLLALRNVAEAQGGVAQLAEKTKLNRESLYKMLSERGNPELRSLDALLHALGFRLAVTVNR